MRSGVTENYPTAIVRNFQFCADLKTEKWKDAKNSIERKNEELRGSGLLDLEIGVLDVLDKIFGVFFLLFFPFFFVIILV